ncbi:piRNA biogenesis protein EXD1-like [Lutzomyia longipalpis]|uniref:Putative deddy 3'-5' exonuclease domain of egalitarian n=1 Tax=Lutzomyia longipalpis TaxID=7200 RepID=A0A7G3AAK6_LUTLO|nr:piRNA biogenesis protein EXD1-like [Lutzomyia longipalpis]
MDYEEFRGQTVLVELEKKKLYGEFQRYDSRMKSIFIKNVKDFNTMKYYTRSATFPVRDIISIHRFANNSEDVKEHNSSSESTISNSNNISVVLTEEEVQNIQMIICNFEYITQIDKKYFQAIEELKAQAFVCGKIAVDVIGGRKGRFSRGSLLILGSPRRIYVVDLMNLGKIPCEVKELLEARKPQKIIHDSCALNDYFLNHGITLSTVSDTWIAHTSVTASTKLITVSECIEEHLKLPMSNLTEKEEALFMRRPLELEQCALAAKQVAYLHHLNEILQEALLKRYYNACRAYQDGISQHDDPAFVAVRVGTKNYQEWLQKFELF